MIRAGAADRRAQAPRPHASEQETNEVVEDVADLIVNFLRGRREPARAGGAGPERNHEPDREQPDTR